MVLSKGEYKIENNGIWIQKNVLEGLRRHYNKIAQRPDQLFGYYYIGKADVLCDFLKMFDNLKG